MKLEADDQNAGVRPGILGFHDHDGDEELDEREGGEVNEGEEKEPEGDKGIENDGEEDGIDEEGEEARTSKGLSLPCRPTPEEVEAHMRTHLPLRSWCEICVRGRAEDAAHSQGKGEESAVAIVGTDYGY